MRKRTTLLAMLFIIGILFNLLGCEQTQINEESQTGQPIEDNSAVDLGKFVVVCEYDGEIDKSQTEMVFEYIKEKILEEYNYIIDGEFIYFPSATFVEEVRNKLAQGDAVDGICASNETLTNFIGYDYLLMDVKPLLDDYGADIKELYRDDDLLKTKVDTKYIGLPDKTLDQQYCTIIRGDVLESLESNAPTTYDELVEFCGKVLDEGLASYPIGLTLQQIKRSWYASWSMASEVFVDDEGVIWPVEYHDNYQNFIEDVKYLYQENYISEDFGSVLDEEQREDFISGKSVIYEINYDESYNIYDELIEVNKDAKLQVMENFTVDSLSDIAQINNNYSKAKSLYFLTSGIGQDALMVFKNYTGASKENYLSVLFGIEDEQFKLEDLDDIMYPKSPYSLNKIYSGELLLGTGFDAIYAPVSITSSDKILELSNDLQLEAYDYLSNAKVIDGGISYQPTLLRDEATEAKLNYYMKVNEGINKYAQGSMKFSDFQLLLEDLKPLARQWCDELSAS